jgi:hypothetical protein
MDKRELGDDATVTLAHLESESKIRNSTMGVVNNTIR